MKKKEFLCFILVVIVSLLLSSCISNSFSIETNNPVAILSVRGTLNVPWLEERDEDYQDLDGVLTNSINKLFGKNNPEIQTAQDRIDYADERIAQLLEENAGITVLPKEQVISSEQYKSITQSVFAVADTKVYANGYKKIDEISPKKSRLLLKELGGESTIFADFTFNKVVVDGSKLKGKITAHITMNIDVYDSHGNHKVMDTFQADSSTLLEISKDDYDRDALVELFPDLTDLVINQFIVKYL